MRAQIFNLRLDAMVCGSFMALVVLIVLEAVRAWWRVLRGPASAPALEVAATEG